MIKNKKHKKTGFVASCFDLLHAGHCLMLEDAKKQCDHLIAALQIDPSIDRPHKKKPVLSLEERRIMLESNKYIDSIVLYGTEKDLEEILRGIRPDVRILGSDYKGKTATGTIYCKEIYYHERNHNYSTTNIRKRLL
jgi:glycerol-3-phosphate cytidylyltransferase